MLLNIGANDSSVPSGCKRIAIQVFLVISAHTVMCCTSSARLFLVLFVNVESSILFVSFLRNCTPCYMYIALWVTHIFVSQACRGFESAFTLFPNTLLRARASSCYSLKLEVNPVYIHIYVVQVDVLG